MRRDVNSRDLADAHVNSRWHSWAGGSSPSRRGVQGVGGVAPGGGAVLRAAILALVDGPRGLGRAPGREPEPCFWRVATKEPRPNQVGPESPTRPYTRGGFLTNRGVLPRSGVPTGSRVGRARLGQVVAGTFPNTVHRQAIKGSVALPESTVLFRGTPRSRPEPAFVRRPRAHRPRTALPSLQLAPRRWPPENPRPETSPLSGGFRVKLPGYTTAVSGGLLAGSIHFRSKSTLKSRPGRSYSAGGIGLFGFSGPKSDVGSKLNSTNQDGLFRGLGRILPGSGRRATEALPKRPSIGNWLRTPQVSRRR